MGLVSMPSPKNTAAILSIVFSAISVRAAIPNVSAVQTPELADKSIVFVGHRQYPQDHHNTANIFQRGEINESSWNDCKGDSAMYRLDFDGDGKPLSPQIVLTAPDGIIRDIEVSYDAKKILFSMRKSFNASYKIYEMDVSSGEIRKLTRLEDAKSPD